MHYRVVGLTTLIIDAPLSEDYSLSRITKMRSRLSASLTRGSPSFFIAAFSATNVVFTLALVVSYRFTAIYLLGFLVCLVVWSVLLVAAWLRVWGCGLTLEAVDCDSEEVLEFRSSILGFTFKLARRDVLQVKTLSTYLESERVDNAYILDTKRFDHVVVLELSKCASGMVVRDESRRARLYCRCWDLVANSGPDRYFVSAPLAREQTWLVVSTEVSDMLRVATS